MIFPDAGSGSVLYSPPPAQALGTPGALPQLPNISAVPAFEPQSSGSGASIEGAQPPPIGTIPGNVSQSQPTTKITVNPSSYAPATGTLADYFLRAVVIILGFIFVAIGLNMFKPGMVPDPRNVVHR